MADLPAVKGTQPVIGWKNITVKYLKPFWELQPHMRGDKPFPAIGAMAACDAREHPTGTRLPVAECSCGFYAHKTHRPVSESHWLAKVQFYGRVIEYTDGWRAEKQDVLEVWPPDNIATITEHDIEELREQFPRTIWHTPKIYPVPPLPQETPGQIHVHYPGGDPFDLLPKELLETLRPGQQYICVLPFTQNAAFGLTLQVSTTNDAIQFELRDAYGSRVGWWRVYGTREWYPPKGH